MNVDENAGSMDQEHLGYTDEEVAKFRSDPKNEAILTKAPASMHKNVVVEVVGSDGCSSQHIKGDKIHLDGAGSPNSQAHAKADVHLCHGHIGIIGFWHP